MLVDIGWPGGSLGRPPRPSSLPAPLRVVQARKGGRVAGVLLHVRLLAAILTCAHRSTAQHNQRALWHLPVQLDTEQAPHSLHPEPCPSPARLAGFVAGAARGRRREGKLPVPSSPRAASACPPARRSPAHPPADAAAPPTYATSAASNLPQASPAAGACSAGAPVSSWVVATAISRSSAAPCTLPREGSQTCGRARSGSGGAGVRIRTGVRTGTEAGTENKWRRGSSRVCCKPGRQLQGRQRVRS